jgi:phage head maturation protease
VRKLSGLYDVSVVVNPAYTQTSVDARSFDATGQEPAPQQTEQLSPELAQLRATLRKYEIEN